MQVQPLTVECNTSDDVLKRNIRQNSALALDWVRCVDEHDGHAVICGTAATGAASTYANGFGDARGSIRENDEKASSHEKESCK